MAEFTGICTPSPFELEALLQRLVRDREQAHHLSVARIEYDRLLSNREAAAHQLERCEQACQAAQAAHVHLVTQWEAWRAGAGLAEPRTPQGAMDCLQQIGDARTHLRALQDLEARCMTLRVKLEEYRRQSAEVLLAAGKSCPDHDSRLTHEVEALYARLQADMATRSTHASVAEAIAALDLKVGALAQELDRALAFRAALYAEAGARDAQEFERRRSVFESRRDLEHSLETLRQDLDTRLGMGERAQELRAYLTSGDVEAWKEAITRLESQAQDVQLERDQANQRVGELKKERAKLEEAADVIAHEHRLRALLEEFRQVSRAWQVRALAQRMIHETIKELERTRQPAVLAQASELFGQVTDGRYPRLAQHEGGDLHIEDLHGIRHDAGDLSRGTMEQLYLCLRLGLIREFARQSVALPLVMDDVFVNFDPERARRVAEAVARFSEDHQVLIFTCHPATAQLLQDVRPETRVLELARYGGMKGQPGVRELTTSLPVANPEMDNPKARQVILACLQESEVPLGKGEILRRTGLADSVWGTAIAALKEEGRIEKKGERKGATYALSPNI